MFLMQTVAVHLCGRERTWCCGGASWQPGFRRGTRRCIAVPAANNPTRPRSQRKFRRAKRQCAALPSEQAGEQVRQVRGAPTTESCCCAEPRSVHACRAEDDITWHEPRNTDEALIVVDDAPQIDFPDGAELPGTAGRFIVLKRVARKPFAATKARLMLIAPRELPETGDTAGNRIVQNVIWI
jgi:hypothetical protein